MDNDNTIMKILKLILILTVTISMSACADRNNKGRPAQPQAPSDGPGPGPSPGPEKPPGPDLETTAPTSPPVIPGVVGEEIERMFSDVQLVESKGGQMLTTYLNGTPDDQVDVIHELFDKDKLLDARFSEMSFAIDEMRAENKYGSTEEEQVKNLEGAIQKYAAFLGDRYRTGETVFEYAVPFFFGAFVGNKWGEPIANWIGSGIRRLGNTGLGQRVSSGTSRVSNGALGLFRRASTQTPRVIPVTEVVRTNMNALMGTNFSKRAFDMRLATPDELPMVRNLDFHPTGIDGFRLAYTPGNNRVTVAVTEKVKRVIDNVEQAVDEEQFVHLYGKKIVGYAASGKSFTLTPEQTAAMTAYKIKQGNNENLAWVGPNGERVSTGLSPTAIRRLKKGAVWAGTSVLTYYIIRPFNPRHLVIEDYVEDIEANGIKLEDFFDLELIEAQAAAELRTAEVAEEPTAENVKTTAEEAVEKGKQQAEELKRQKL